MICGNPEQPTRTPLLQSPKWRPEQEGTRKNDHISEYRGKSPQVTLNLWYNESDSCIVYAFAKMLNSDVEAHIKNNYTWNKLPPSVKQVRLVIS